MAMIVVEQEIAAQEKERGNTLVKEGKYIEVLLVIITRLVIFLTQSAGKGCI